MTKKITFQAQNRNTKNVARNDTLDKNLLLGPLCTTLKSLTDICPPVFVFLFYSSSILILKYSFWQIVDVSLLDKRGYLTICLTLAAKDGKLFLRKPEGIRDWYQTLKVKLEHLCNNTSAPSTTLKLSLSHCSTTFLTPNMSSRNGSESNL